VLILNPEYAQKTLRACSEFLWGEKCNLETVKNKLKFKYTANKSKEIDVPIDIDI
jgi:hypothetical protein